MSKYISTLTKQDVISILKSGIDIYQRGPYLENGEIKENNDSIYTAKMNIFGRMDEIEFLSRLYDLENMESYDSRFPNFKGDIIQHRYNNYDWDDYWFFDDDRLQLFSDDEHFLNFIKEIFNPYVREEKSNWKIFFENINDLLKIDGYELYESSKVSGRALYSWKRIDSVKKNNNKTFELKMIGSGSYANVYYYNDDDYDLKVALKRAHKDLNEEEIKRFRLEYVEMKKMNSPYIVSVYKYNNDNNEYTMEYIDNTLYKFVLKNNNKLKANTRANIVNQFLKGLKYIHSKKILHRDLSYSNILIKEMEDNLIVKISDFGLIKTEYSDLTKSNESIKGSLRDPNLNIVGYKNYKIYHEIYSVMFIIYFIMTGKQDLSLCKDEKFKQFLKKGIDTNVNNRYKDIDEVISAFRNYLISK